MAFVIKQMNKQKKNINLHCMPLHQTSLHSHHRGILLLVHSLYHWNCLKAGTVSIKILKILFTHNHIKIWNNHKGMTKLILKLLWIILRPLKNVCSLSNNSSVIIKPDLSPGFTLINSNTSADSGRELNCPEAIIYPNDHFLKPN